MDLQSATLVCLHGYLGLPNDWETVFGPTAINRLYPNLFTDFPITTFDSWASTFNQWVFENTKRRPKILVGYSLGGRLAIHALRDSFEQWDAAILISTHPGLVSEEEKVLRIKSDLDWANVIRNEPWDVVMKKWNSQSIFKEERHPLKRNECDFDRDSLAEAMKKWSLGAQEDLQNTLFCLKMPLLWIVGEKDKKFAKEAERIQFSHPSSSVVVVPEAGHRIFADQPKKMNDEMKQFLRNLQ